MRLISPFHLLTFILPVNLSEMRDRKLTAKEKSHKEMEKDRNEIKDMRKSYRTVKWMEKQSQEYKADMRLE